MRSISVCVLAAALATPAFADDGPTASLSVAASQRLGPVPEELSFERVDTAIGKTWWHRLHLGVDAAVGTGGNASSFEQVMLDAGLWLHASERIDVLSAWRVGYAHFSIFDMPVGAKVIEAVPAEFRVRIRDSLDVRFAPVVATNYFAGVWSLFAGPELGLVWRL